LPIPEVRKPSVRLERRNWKKPVASPSYKSAVNSSKRESTFTVKSRSKVWTTTRRFHSKPRFLKAATRFNETRRPIWT
jgi:hypothetical protein